MACVGVATGLGWQEAVAYVSIAYQEKYGVATMMILNDVASLSLFPVTERRVRTIWKK